MKQILFYTDTPLLGGAENQMLLLAKYLPKDRYNVTLACSSYQNLNQWCQQFMMNGIKVQRLKVLHKHDPRHYLYLKKLLPGMDLLHLHLWNPASCRFALMAAKNIPVVITEHDPFPLTGIKAYIKEKLSDRVKAIIATSEAAKKLVLEQNSTWEPRTHVVPNGIDIDEWRRECILESRTEFRRTNFGTVKNEKIILCVAELNKRKGQKYLIKAMEDVLNSFPDTKLVLVGSGWEKRYYEKLARPWVEKIIFLGQRRDIAQLMTASDLFVLPSIREAFGLVILEAAIADLPIIASNVGGIPEIVENEKTGLLVAPSDSGKLAEAIKTLFSQPEYGIQLLKAAREKTETSFSAKTMAEKTAEVYDKIFI